MIRQIFLAILLTFALFACRKEESINISPNIRLQFSTDSLLFDTVFTSSGTTNRTLKIFNYNNSSVILSKIGLLGGNASAFKININGEPTSSLSNVKIAANDSIYIFVKAFIDPTNANTPFLVEDEIQILLNGNEATIPLAAYGQNAVYLNKTDITSATVFAKGKPYIIYDYVHVAENTTLQIEAGARLYFHKNAKLLISGTLKAEGSLTDSITFTSDRMERIYRDEPGQWDGIRFSANSVNNSLNYCAVQNALAGVTVDSLSKNSNPKLLLTNSVVKNHQVAGVLAYQGSITGINNLMYNCGQYLIVGFGGGDYNFYQNTLANYNFNFPRKTPSVYFSNYALTDASQIFSLKTQFFNNIIYGSLNTELAFDKKGTEVFIKDFQNNLIKGSLQDLGETNLYNVDPLFINTRKEDYQLVSNSPAHEKGKDLSANSYYANFFTKDFLGIARVFPSSLGCFEK